MTTDTGTEKNTDKGATRTLFWQDGAELASKKMGKADICKESAIVIRGKLSGYDRDNKESLNSQVS